MVVSDWGLNSKQVTYRQAVKNLALLDLPSTDPQLSFADVLEDDDSEMSEE